MGVEDSGLGGIAGPIGTTSLFLFAASTVFSDSFKDWGTIHPSLQYQLYLYYGDKRLMEEQYEYTKRWTEFILSKANSDWILDDGLGDWMQLGTPPPSTFIGTSFLYHNVKLFVTIAEILGSKYSNFILFSCFFLNSFILCLQKLMTSASIRRLVNG